MRRSEDLDEEDARRWAEAVSVARGAEPGEFARRGQRRVRLVVVPVAVLAACVVWFALTRWLGDDDGAADVAPWREVLGGVCMVSGWLVLVVGLVLQSRRARRSLRSGRTALLALRRSQVRAVRATVRGRRPVQAERLPVALVAARMVALQDAYVPFALVGFPLLLLLPALLLDFGSRLTTVAALVAGTMSLGAVVTRRDAVRARAFLVQWETTA